MITFLIRHIKEEENKRAPQDLVRNINVAEFYVTSFIEIETKQMEIIVALFLAKESDFLHIPLTICM